MKITKNILVLTVAVLALSVLSGCSTSADSLLSLKSEFKILPKARVYVGKEAKKVEAKAMDATNTRVAMDNGVITTADELKAREAALIANQAGF